jgi:phage tail-like protein
MSEPEGRSSYLDHIPPVLWDTGADPGGFSLNTLLLAAETILGGLGGREPVVHRTTAGTTHTHDSIEAVIDRLHLLLDPRRAPRRFLPWLAGWVGVELSAQWSEHQQRRAVAEMVPALAHRGLVEGLNRYLDLYTVAATRPRIAIDDGARILFTTPAPGRQAPVHALLSHGPYLRDRTAAAYPGLVQPRCIAATPDGDLLVGDDGVNRAGPVGPGIWRVGRTGAYVDTEAVRTAAGSAGPPRPHPLGRTIVRPPGTPANPLAQPKAVVVEGGPGAWRSYVLDSGALYRLVSDRPDELVELRTRDQLNLFDQDGLMLDGAGRLLVVSRRGFVVEIDANTSPATVAPRRPLVDGLVPGSVLLLGRHVLVGDIRSQAAGGGSADPRPADLVLLDRSDPADWQQRRLVRDDLENPLIAPIALATDGPDAVLVLDAGLRPLSGDPAFPFNRVRAEPAALYRVTLTDPTDPARIAVARIEQVTEFGRLTWPTGMAVVDGVVYITDAGDPTEASPTPRFRDGPGDVAVVVHFSKERPVPLLQQRAITHDVAAIVEAHKPASAVARRPHSPDDSEEDGEEEG